MGASLLLLLILFRSRLLPPLLSPTFRHLPQCLGAAAPRQLLQLLLQLQLRWAGILRRLLGACRAPPLPPASLSSPRDCFHTLSLSSPLLLLLPPSLTYLTA